MSYGNKPTWRTRPLIVEKQNRKRSRRAIEDEDADEDEETARIQPKRQGLGTRTPNVSWGCPFWKRDPIHHMDCTSYKLKRIQDVKQHLARKHYEASIYCPICQQKFPDIKERDHHIRQRECTEKSTGRMNLPTASIPPEKQRKLRARMTGSDENIWHQMWDILFDGEPPPTTPYQKTIIEEVSEFMQEFWREHQSEILLDITHGHSRDANSDFIRARLPSLMSSALSTLVGRVRGAIHNTDYLEPTSPTADNSSVSTTSTASSEPLLWSAPATSELWTDKYPNFKEVSVVQQPSRAGHGDDVDFGGWSMADFSLDFYFSPPTSFEPLDPQALLADLEIPDITSSRDDSLNTCTERTSQTKAVNNAD
ncbi:hypothetical protein B0T21DRAFT_413718 [Apiosordaria backusii]|uniref:C2H2-type domain-containing protein n=1 Tax=Apiosordaria backusii TaxID=314023 RepID=A0AA40B2B9_9PEZI|nr:hypothetical protein B0T21DRAFT_413718 [Apiosordaria backusii]